jgi:hypothetical protein
VSERAGAKAGGSNPSAMTTPSRVVAVKGILVCWKAALFAGLRRNAGLGRSVVSHGYPPEGAGAPMTADVRRTPRRGTPSACATYAHAPDAGTRHRCMRPGTRPSLGPSTRARRSSLCSAAQVSEVGRTSRHHGWANSGNRDEPALGPSHTDVARLAVCHRFRKGEGVAHRRKGRRSRSPSLRGPQSSGLVARTS